VRCDVLPRDFAIGWFLKQYGIMHKIQINIGGVLVNLGR
jgi:hypothetical protein